MTVVGNVSWIKFLEFVVKLDIFCGIKDRSFTYRDLKKY